MKLAIYDLDRTITRIGTYTPFLIFAARRRAIWRLLLLPIWIVLMLGYVAKIYDRKALKERGFLLLIGSRITANELATLSNAYADHVMRRNVHAGVLDLIEQDRANGYRLVLATASPDYYATPLGRLLGMDHVIATVQAQTPAGDYLWRIASPNCYGQDKLDMIRQWLDDQAAAKTGMEARFYTDSSSDLPTLRWSTGPVAVNPSRKLHHIAVNNGWSVKTFA